VARRIDGLFHAQVPLLPCMDIDRNDEHDDSWVASPGAPVCYDINDVWNDDLALNLTLESKVSAE